MTELYPRILSHALDNGCGVAPRGMETLELSPFVFELADPTQCLVLQRARRLNYAYVIIERLALLTGEDSPEMLCAYISRLRDSLNPDTGCFDGAYGPRVHRQLKYVFDELTRDPDSRRAIITLYSEADQQPESMDVPCTLALHFMIRRGRLDLIVHMRSSDLFLGLPYDVSQFAFLQQLIAGWLNVDVGRYIHWADSAHIYDDDRRRARKVTDAPKDLLDVELPAPRLPFESTLQQAEVLATIERDIRLAQIAHALEDDSRMSSLAPEFQSYAVALHDYGQRRWTQQRSPDVFVGVSQ